jgi:hypothetical protein
MKRLGVRHHSHQLSGGSSSFGLLGHMRKTPNRRGSPANLLPSNRSIGALRLAEIAKASTVRVSAGSMTPSSHSRALA